MATDGVIELDERRFSEAVNQGLMLVDFWAPWCGPCRAMTPVLESVAEELGDAVTVAKVNVDASPQLAGAFGIRSIPALFIIRDGQVVDQRVGVQSKEALIDLLRSHSSTDAVTG